MNSGALKEQLTIEAADTQDVHELCLAQGYREMSQINRRLAEEGLFSDNAALQLAEQNLRSVNDCDS